jgi:nicotinate-nucleotide adenylyltransferase
MQSIAIFGGAFDPIHNGHLQVSLTIQSQFNFDSYILLPCKTPTLKSPTLADTTQRIDMLHLALKEYPNFKLDLREIERTTPSYTVETLQSFRAQYPTASITFILGYDAFLSLPQWHQWEQLIKLAHLLVINRAGLPKQTQNPVLQQFMNAYQNEDKAKLLNTKAGTLFLFNAGEYDISSTAIREALKKGEEIDSKIPEAVYEYIKEAKLYGGI